MIRLAIIGAGIGAQHMDAYLALQDRFEVKAICDLDQARGQALAARGQTTHWTQDYQSVLSDPEIRLIDICLPPHLHFSFCMQALDAGKHVICEKPLVTSLAECDRLIERSRDTGCRIFPVFQYRYGLGSAQLHALMKAGLTGRCLAGSLETHWDRPESYYDIPWRGTWEGEQGGAVLGHAIHIHDLLTCFLGPIERVHAELATRVNDIETEDCAALSIRMTSGAVITSSITLGAATNTSRLRLIFEKLTTESDHSPYSPSARPWQFHARAPHSQSRIGEILSALPNAAAGYKGLFSEIARALRDEPSREVTLQEARQSLAFVTAVYASAASGRPEVTTIPKSHSMYQGWTGPMSATLIPSACGR